MATLIATLGSEPQVVTLTLDRLGHMGRTVDQAVVLHTSPHTAPIGAALDRLAEAMTAYRGVRFAPELIETDDGRPLTDVDTLEGSRACFRALYGAMRQAKQAEERLEVCLAGGRKTMSAYAMVAAQLLFDDGDRLWHLISSGSLLHDKRMHAREGDEVALVGLPVLRFGDVSPLLSDVAEADDPFEALERADVRDRALRLRHARAFVRDALTEAERRVVRELVRTGAADTDIARLLNVAVRTAQGQLASAYRKAEDAFALPRVSSRALISLLGDIREEI